MSKKPSRRRARRTSLLRTQQLEDRSLMAIDVTTTDDVIADDGFTSLREAIIEANTTPGVDTINVPAGTYTLTITGDGENDSQTGDLDILEGVSIVGGTGNPNDVIVQAGSTSWQETLTGGDGIDRVFDVPDVDGDSFDVSFSGMTVRHGRVFSNGGGIRYSLFDQLNLSDMIVTDNAALAEENTPRGGGVYSWGVTTILRSTIANNTAERGGGIYQDYFAGDVALNISRIQDTAIHGNQAFEGGGVWVGDGVTEILNSTISSNQAAEGGGVYQGLASSDSYLRLTNVTVTQNTATIFEGGGLYRYDEGASQINPASFLLWNTIVAENILLQDGVPIAFASDVSGTFVSQGNNLIGIENGGAGFIPSDLLGDTETPLDPELGPLQNNGGPTFTHELLRTPNASPAIDAGNNAAADAFSLEFDQRLTGFPRIINSIVDIGAYEANGADLSLTKTVSDSEPISGQEVFFTITVTNDGPLAATNVVVTDLLPAGLQFESFVASAGTYDENTGLWTVGDLAAEASATLTINVTVTLTLGFIFNVAEVTAVDQPDPDSTPNNGDFGEDDLSYAYLDVRRAPVLVLGAEAGSKATGIVKVYGFDGKLKSSFLAYGTATSPYRGGVRVAVGDVNGDGTLEIITAPGRSHTPLVKVFDLAGNELTEFRIQAYASSFKNGLFVAVGDVVGDGREDIIVSPSRGASEVRVFENLSASQADPFANPSGQPETPTRSFLAFPKSFIGGSTVAAGDVVPGGKQEVIVGSLSGMRATVKVFDVSTNIIGLVKTFLPFASSFRGGIFVSAGYVNFDGAEDILVSTNQSGGSRVQILSGADGELLQSHTIFNGKTKQASLRIAAGDLDGDGLVDAVMLGQGSDGREQRIKHLDPQVLTITDFLFEKSGELSEVFDDPDFKSGVFLAVGDGLRQPSE